MKKFLSLLLCIVCLFAFLGCDNNNEKKSSDNPPSPAEDVIPSDEKTLTYCMVKQNSSGFDTDELKTWGTTDNYNLQTSITPVWTTKNVYNETVSFIGKDDVATLMYTPTQIYKVYDYFLQKEYKEGEDFTVSGNKISLTENTTINYWERKDYYYAGPQGSYTIKTDKGYLKFSEVVPNTHQICVCYEHSGKYMGVIPEAQTDKFPNVNEKIKNGGTINICVTGDSITKGCGSSGYIMTSEPARNNLPGGDPYVIAFPSYINLVKEFIESKGVTVNLDNTAVGGSGVGNGVNQINNWSITPDLAIIAFGMNNAGKDTNSFYNETKALIDKVRTLNPNCEILLVSSMIPNPEVLNWLGNISNFEKQSLLPLIDEYEKIGLAPVMSVSQGLYYKLGKKFEDLNSNSINHPNNFLHGIYAQTALTVMFGNEYYK